MGVDINWGGYNSFFERNNMGDSLVRGFDQGQAERKVKLRENALSQYATNPNDPGAINALAQVDPMLALQAQEKMALTAERQRRTKTELSEASRANVLKGAQIIRQTQPKDQAGWDRALATAQAAGIDVSTVPRQFDPNFAANMVNLADTFEPVKAEASPYQFIPYQPGGGVLRADKISGTTTELIRPNDGSAPAGAPVVSQEKANGVRRVTDQSTYEAVPPGEQYMAPDGTIRTKPAVTNGGPASPAPGVFRP